MLNNLSFTLTIFAAFCVANCPKQGNKKYRQISIAANAQYTPTHSYAIIATVYHIRPELSMPIFEKMKRKNGGNKSAYIMYIKLSAAKMVIFGNQILHFSDFGMLLKSTRFLSRNGGFLPYRLGVADRYFRFCFRCIPLAVAHL